MSDTEIGARTEHKFSWARPFWWLLNVLVVVLLFGGVNYWCSYYLHTAVGREDFAIWSWLPISFELWSRAPALVTHVAWVMTGGIVVCVMSYALGLWMLRRRSDPVDDLHGTARWATRSEIAEEGLLAPGGVYVGGFHNHGKMRYLRHNGPEHVLAFAPTRSGKGVGLVLPTLLDWRESVIIHDPKGEAWALTSGWRKHAGQSVMRFDPTEGSPACARFNPLSELRIGQQEEVADVQNLAYILADPDGEGLKDHWSKTAHALLTGVILHCCYVARTEWQRDATLSEVATFLSDPNRSIETVLNEMVTYPHVDGEPHAVVAEEARAMLNRDTRELSSVLSTAISYLSLYRDPMVAAATDESDFRIQDLISADKPVSLYLIVRPSDSARLRPLTRLILTQVVRRLCGKMEFADGRTVAHYKHRLLLLLDEFAALQRLAVIEEALPYMAGYGLKAYLIVQDMSQLTHVYGREESLVSNCHLRIAFAPNKLETAQLISNMTGQQTIVRRQVSSSGSRGDIMLGNVSESNHEVSRSLLTSDEVMRLPGAKKNAKGDIIRAGDMLIFVAGARPIYGRQILFFQDRVFLARSQVPSPAISDRTVAVVDAEEIEVS